MWVGRIPPFPSYLSQKFGCETWVVDDFGMDVNDPFWLRNQSPHQHIEAHPENKYVLERVGNPETSSLPTGYFNVIYSASALEHVPPELTLDVWRHMTDLLAPQGELIHAIDILFPSNGGFKKMFQTTLFDWMPWLFPQKMRHSHYLATPLNYSRMVCNALSVKIPSLPGLDIWNMCLNPDILTESLTYGWNRVIKGDVEDYSFQRVGNLLLHFVKS